MDETIAAGHAFWAAEYASRGRLFVPLHEPPGPETCPGPVLDWLAECKNRDASYAREHDELREVLGAEETENALAAARRVVAEVEKQIADLIRERDALALRLHATEAENAALRERSVPEGWVIEEARRPADGAIVEFFDVYPTDGTGQRVEAQVYRKHPIDPRNVRFPLATAPTLRAACEAADKAALNAAGTAAPTPADP